MIFSGITLIRFLFFFFFFAAMPSPCELFWQDIILSLRDISRCLCCVHTALAVCLYIYVNFRKKKTMIMMVSDHPRGLAFSPTFFSFRLIEFSFFVSHFICRKFAFLSTLHMCLCDLCVAFLLPYLRIWPIAVTS